MASDTFSFAGAAPVPANCGRGVRQSASRYVTSTVKRKSPEPTLITARSRAALDGVGAPVRGVEVTIGGNDELQVRSPSAFTRTLVRRPLPVAPVRGHWRPRHRPDRR